MVFKVFITTFPFPHAPLHFTHSDPCPSVHLTILVSAGHSLLQIKHIYLKILTFVKKQCNPKVVLWITVSCSHFGVYEFSDSLEEGTNLVGQEFEDPRHH